MIRGMSESTFTTFHVLLSLVGIASGIVLMVGLLRAQTAGTLLFLATTVASHATFSPLIGSVN
jgi:hypothetical protein